MKFPVAHLVGDHASQRYCNATDLSIVQMVLTNQIARTIARTMNSVARCSENAFQRRGSVMAKSIAKVSNENGSTFH